jgi:hypothetical protein
VGKVKKAGAVGKSIRRKAAKAKKSRSGVTLVTKVTRKAAAKPRNQEKTAKRARTGTGTRSSKHAAATKAAKPVRTTARKARRSPPPPDSTFRVRELDPVQKCGAGTSVQRMFRVDEASGGVVRPHLVFFDRHGLYCEHGRDCPAVPHARSVMANNNPKHLDRFTNGRMRA